jgi:ABC-2 type transport system permease protein
MTGQFRAELLKIRSTRTTVGLVVGMVGLILLFSLLTGLLTKAPNLVTTEDQRGLLVVGAYAGVFSALAGIMLVTSEYRYGTIKPTFVFTPRRSRVVVAKVAAGVLAGLAFGIVGTALGFGIGYACLAGRGIDYALNDRQTALLLVGTVVGTAIWGGIGVGLGAILRSQVAAIIGVLAWAFVAENLLFAFLPGIGPLRPYPRRRCTDRSRHRAPPSRDARRPRRRRLGSRALTSRDHPRRPPRRRLAQRFVTVLELGINLALLIAVVFTHVGRRVRDAPAIHDSLIIV